jgi:hypothetical protein
MFVFPVHLFNPTSIKAGVVENVISGGTSLSGDEDVISTDGGGRWQITYGGISLRSLENERKWDAWVSHLAGGGRAIYAPLLSLRTAPRPIAGGIIARPSAIYADDAYFPTEVYFASPYIVAETVGAALLRATTLTISVTLGARVQGGEKFSVDGRAYKIERVTARSGQEATCVISPPLRAAIASGTAVEFGWPYVQAKAAVGQDLIPDMAFGRNGTVSITFVEDFSA